MKPVVSVLRAEELLFYVCLDDILCLGSDKNSCLVNTEKKVSLLENLGFLINEKKSKLIPSTQRKYLSFIINSIKMTVELTSEKREKMIQLVNVFFD